MGIDSERSTPFNPVVTLGNNGVTVIFNSTYGLMTTPSSTVNGSYRNRYAGVRLEGSLLPTVQPVTLFFAEFNDAAGSWTIVNGGGTGLVVAAGAFQDFSYLPRTPDFQAYITNGATGPSALTVTAQIHRQRSQA